MQRTTVPHPDAFSARYIPIVDAEDDGEEALRRLSLTAMTLTIVAFVSIFLGVLVFAHLS